MYQIPQLLNEKGLFHRFSTKDEGNMANSILGKVINFDQVLVNRKRFLQKINIDINTCIAMWVLAEDGVQVADPNEAGVSMLNYQKAVKVDAIITNKIGLNLFLLTADCAPLILYDPEKTALALVHVGWKGAHLNIVGKVINKLNREYRSKTEDILAVFGPYAHKDSFIKENPSQKDDPHWKGFVEKVDADKYQVDFAGLCKKQLKDAGVKEAHIIDCDIDTVKDGRFFSHLREAQIPLEDQGRFACVAGLR